MTSNWKWMMTLWILFMGSISSSLALASERVDVAVVLGNSIRIFEVTGRELAQVPIALPFLVSPATKMVGVDGLELLIDSFGPGDGKTEGIFAVNVLTGKARFLLGAHSAAFLAGKKQIAFLSNERDPRNNGLWLFDLEAGSDSANFVETKLFDHHSSTVTRGPVIVADSKIVFSARRTGFDSLLLIGFDSASNEFEHVADGCVPLGFRFAQRELLCYDPQAPTIDRKMFLLNLSTGRRSPWILEGEVVTFSEDGDLVVYNRPRHAFLSFEPDTDVVVRSMKTNEEKVLLRSQRALAVAFIRRNSK